MKATKKHRKWTRNASFCLAYKMSHRREHNKVRRLNRHLATFPGDKVAGDAVAACKVAIRGY